MVFGQPAQRIRYALFRRLVLIVFHTAAQLFGDVPQQKRRTTLDNFRDVTTAVLGNMCSRRIHGTGYQHVIKSPLPMTRKTTSNRIWPHLAGSGARAPHQFCLRG